MAPTTETPVRTGAQLVCHCRRVPHSTVEAAIGRGCHTIAEIQDDTTACTRCFGCRFEIEQMLTDALGEEYRPTPFVTRPPQEAPARGGLRGLLGRLGGGRSQEAVEKPPRRMYMPILSGYGGYDVDTRFVMYNWRGTDGEPVDPVTLRADVLALDGTRLAVTETTIAPGCSAVLTADDLLGGAELPGGVGTCKVVVDAAALGSLRPYFHLVTETGITTTHEKAGLDHPHNFPKRETHWAFPIGGATVGEEAYWFAASTQDHPIEGHRLIWRSVEGEEASVPVEDHGLDQTCFVALHEHFPAILKGVPGSVRLEPSLHKLSPFMIRHQPDRALWRVQHL